MESELAALMPPTGWIVHGMRPVFVKMSDTNWVNVEQIVEVDVLGGVAYVTLRNGSRRPPFVGGMALTIEEFWATATITPGREQ